LLPCASLCTWSAAGGATGGVAAAAELVGAVVVEAAPLPVAVGVVVVLGVFTSGPAGGSQAAKARVNARTGAAIGERIGEGSLGGGREGER